MYREYQIRQKSHVTSELWETKDKDRSFKKKVTGIRESEKERERQEERREGEEGR